MADEEDVLPGWGGEHGGEAVAGQQETEDDLLSWQNIKNKLDDADAWAGRQLNGVGNSIADGIGGLASMDPWSPFRRAEESARQKSITGLMTTQERMQDAGAGLQLPRADKGIKSERLQAYSFPAPRGGSVDHRIRIRPFPSMAKTFYDDPKDGSIDGTLLSVLSQTNGVIFPYTPTITGLSHNVNYTAVDTVHSNQEFYAYRNTEALKLTIAGQFTASNYREARYMLACMHFLRSCTKMRFGTSEPDATRGLPPPVLLLSGLGQYMFNDLPIILTNVTFDYPNNVDLVPVLGTVSGKQTTLAWVPVMQTISVSLTIQNTPKRVRDFNFKNYVNGDLLTNKPGGFI